MSFSSFLRCPLCGDVLVRDGGSLFCGGRTGKRHCYDISREGYVNLLPPGKKNNARTGDEADMIAARRRFLGGGYYDGISDAAASLCARLLFEEKPKLHLLDAGSGEGYHTCRIARRLSEMSGAAVEMCGIDASKRGAASGARLASAMPAGTEVSFAAGNIFSLPVADRSVDAVFSLFAPVPGAEAHRVLRDDGVLIVVASGSRHLWELRSLLYEEVRENTEAPAVPEGFTPVAAEKYRASVHIPDPETLNALFTMTPFYYRSPREGRERLASAKELTVRVEADLYAFRKCTDHNE